MKKIILAIGVVLMVIGLAFSGLVFAIVQGDPVNDVYIGNDGKKVSRLLMYVGKFTGTLNGNPLDFERRTYIKFNVNITPETGYKIIVSEAEFGVWALPTDPSYKMIPGGYFAVHQVTSDWSEDTISWENQPRFESTPIDTLTTSTNPHKFDVTQWAKEWVEGEDNYGFVITASDGCAMYFYSIEHGIEKGYGSPYLQIRYALDPIEPDDTTPPEDKEVIIDDDVSTNDTDTGENTDDDFTIGKEVDPIFLGIFFLGIGMIFSAVFYPRFKR